MTIIYTIGRGAYEGKEATNDWELRMSLRSWRKFAQFKHAIDYLIVGHCPDWLDTEHGNITHLPAGDPYRSNKDANIIQKLIKGFEFLNGERQKDEAIFCSDDQGLLRFATSEAFQPYHSGPISKIQLSGDQDSHRTWQDRLVATGEFLKSQGVREPLHFDAHIPYRLEREQVLRVMDSDYGASPGYTVMSLLYGLKPPRPKPIPIDSDRIRAGMNDESVDPHTVDWKMDQNQFYNISGGSTRNWYLVHKFEERFSEPAPWEIDACERTRRDVALLKDKDFERQIENARAIALAADSMELAEVAGKGEQKAA